MWSKLRQWLAPPVFPGDEDKTRIASLLNPILLIVIGLVMVFSVPALFQTPEFGRIVIELALAAIAGGLIVLMRRGMVQLAAFLLSLLLWVMVSFGTYEASGFAGSTMSSYFGIILIAGLLLGGRAATVIGALSIFVTWWMMEAQKQGTLPPVPTYATIDTFWAEFAATVVGVVGLLALVMNSLYKALEQVRKNQRALAVKAEEAQLLAQHAIEANQFKSQLIARVSHELRTPLGAILGLTEMLHEGVEGPISDEQRKHTQRVIENAHYLDRLIAELLEQSQLEAGRLVLRVSDFSPSSVLKYIETTFRPLAESKSLTLLVQTDPQMPPRLRGDASRVQQILYNLVGNAIKFTLQGSVQVKVYPVNQTEWAMQVTDTGMGIEAKAQAIIFEPFRQADETPTRRFGGVGLGLAIVKQLTQAMRGQVQLTTTVGKGTQFTVTLPITLPDDINELNEQGK